MDMELVLQKLDEIKESVEILLELSKGRRAPSKRTVLANAWTIQYAERAIREQLESSARETSELDEALYEAEEMHKKHQEMIASDPLTW